jgi:hypothetical protein
VSTSHHNSQVCQASLPVSTRRNNLQVCQASLHVSTSRHNSQVCQASLHVSTSHHNLQVCEASLNVSTSHHNSQVCKHPFLCLPGVIISKYVKRTSMCLLNKQTNTVALGPQANYTDCSTATCRRNLVPTFVDRGVSRG